MLYSLKSINIFSKMALFVYPNQPNITAMAQPMVWFWGRVFSLFDKWKMAGQSGKPVWKQLLFSQFCLVYLEAQLLHALPLNEVFIALFCRIGKQFELPLLLQSVVMILTMLVMLHLCCSIQSSNRVSTKQHHITGNHIKQHPVHSSSVKPFSWKLCSSQCNTIHAFLSVVKVSNIFGDHIKT